MPGTPYYPLSTCQPWPLRQWWVAARSSELTTRPFGRTLLDRPVVLFRTESGQPVALPGGCPHRLYPLARGRVIGETIECGYHGMRFDAAGRCVHVPSHPACEPRLATQAFPLREHGGLAWIWMGEPALAGEHALPDIDAAGVGCPGWATEYHPLATVKARYTLMIENLMDLSHITFIHADTIPGAAAIAALPFEVLETERSLTLRRVARSLPVNPYLQRLFPSNSLPVDQTIDAEYLGPCLIRTGGPIEVAAGGDANRLLGHTHFVHALTPETAHSVHYFVQTTRDFRIDDQGIAHMQLESGNSIQPQDIHAVELIEQSAARFGDPRREISMPADAGAIRIRRRLSRQIAAEEAPG